MTPSTLFVSDLDGTLLDAGARLSECGAEMLNRAIAAGALFTVATARTPATVQPIMEGVHLDMPAIVMTGAALWHFDTSTFSDVHFIDSGHVRLILDVFRHNDVCPFVYTLTTSDLRHRLRVFYHRRNPNPVDGRFIDLRKDLALKEFVFEELPSPFYSSVVLFFASGPKDVLTTVGKQIASLTQCSVSCYDDIYNPGVGLIEIFAPHVSKAGAICKMRENYNINNVVVFGDNLNDLPMFRVADTSVAVENALPEVKEAARIVIESNLSDAVPRYILEQL